MSTPEQSEVNHTEQISAPVALRRAQGELYDILGRVRYNGLDDERFDSFHERIASGTSPEELQKVGNELRRLDESTGKLHEPDTVAEIVPPVVEADETPPANAESAPTPSELEFEQGPEGFLIVEGDGTTKRKPSSEEEEDIIDQYALGNEPKPGRPKMLVRRLDDDALAELEGAPAAGATGEVAPRTPLTLDERKERLRARLNAVKDKMGEAHFNKLAKFIDEAENDDQTRSMHQTLQYY